MALWNLGSINADLFYSVPHFPAPGETLAATGHDRGLGGKGANISVAAARAAARVCHIGAVGADGLWARERLLEYGVDTRHIHQVGAPTGQALILTDPAGENQIVLLPGANRVLGLDELQPALSEASAGDWFVTQNETSAQAEGMELARQMGLKTAYVAAPFDAEDVGRVIHLLDLLILNEIEAQQLEAAFGKSCGALGVPDVIVTRGPEGSSWIRSGTETHIPAVRVKPVDTTGAGDTFAGYLLAGLDRGHAFEQALATASLAAAIMVTRSGTADVIPDLRDLEEFRLG